MRINTINPSEDIVIYPYRRVWQSAIIESGALFSVVIIISIISGLNIIPPQFYRLVNIIVASIPLIVWILTAVIRERLAQQPRAQLISTIIIAMLVAQAIGYPIMANILQSAQWIDRGTLFERIIQSWFGLTILHEIIKYLIIRYTIWENHLNIRYDIVAYTSAVVWGYTFVLHLNYLFSSDPTPALAVITLWSLSARHLFSSLAISYNIVEARLHNPNPLLLPITISFVSLLQAVAFTLEKNLSAARVTLEITQPRLIISILIPLVLLFIIFPTMIFLFRNAEQEEEEKTRSQT